MINFITHDNVAGKTVFLRVDLNVPCEQGRITDFNRIDSLQPTIDLLVQAGCKIVLASHFGRPKGIDKNLSLDFLVSTLQMRLGIRTHFADHCIGERRDEIIANAKPGEIILLENLRFISGEKSNDLNFAKALAQNIDIYINDAFACSHRPHASIDAITNFLPKFGGLLMQSEISNIDSALGDLDGESTVIIGGSKVSTKFDILRHLSSKVKNIVIGGAMANTFLEARGSEIGLSLHEPFLVDDAREFLLRAKCNIITPIDVVCAKKESGLFVHEEVRSLSEVTFDDIILDIGPQSVNVIEKILGRSNFLLWNGPLGMVEDSRFAAATHKTARIVAQLTYEGSLKSVAGGGDVVGALNVCNVAHKFSYISTAGGAFLEYIGGHKLPGLEALKR